VASARASHGATAVAVAVGLHAGLLWLLPGAEPHASGLRSPAAITLVAVKSPSMPPADSPGVHADDVVAAVPAPVPAVAHAARQRAGRPSPSASAAAPAPVDLTAQPRSAPDIAALQGLPFSGLPMRLRLTIDSTGRVVDVAVLHSLDDKVVNEAVQRMFLATAFVPARRGGVDVASVEDIELSLDDVR